MLAKLSQCFFHAKTPSRPSPQRDFENSLRPETPLRICKPVLVIIHGDSFALNDLFRNYLSKYQIQHFHLFR